MAVIRRADHTGKRFGMLTAIEYVRNTDGKDPEAIWLCQCDCGVKKTFRASQFTRTTEPSRSCGCQSKIKGPEANRTHGCAGKGMPEYAAWQHMLSRCRNPKNRRYHLYGARGIYVCARWESDFANFLADMGIKPSPKHSIDRIDNDGPYSPDNCRWATREQQDSNKTVTHLITHEGQTKTISEWSRITNLTTGAIYGRLLRGWSTQKAFTTPPRKTRSRLR